MPSISDSEVPSREELLRRAEALVPVLRERSERCEALRKCPEETVADFVSHGLTRICQPRRFGGYELGWDVHTEVCLILARGCGSQAWFNHILTDHAQKIGAFELLAQNEVWGDDPTTRIGSGLDFVGKASPAPGGVIYSGQHGFSSGIDHVQWLICGGQIIGDGQPRRCYFLLPRSEATVTDDWHVMGLAGTGSKSFQVREVFVPNHRIMDATLGEDGTGPGTLVNTAPIFRMPFLSVAGTAFAAIAVGIADGFLGEWVRYTRGRRSRGIAKAEQMGTQIEVGRSEIEIDAARHLCVIAARDAMSILARGAPLDAGQRLKTRLRSSFAAQLALTAVHRLFNAAGGRVNYSTNRLQRQLRDVEAAATHISLDWNEAAANFGAHRLSAAAEV